MLLRDEPLKLIVEILVQVKVNELSCFPLSRLEGAMVYFGFLPYKGGNHVAYRIILFFTSRVTILL